MPFKIIFFQVKEAELSLEDWKKALHLIITAMDRHTHEKHIQISGNILKKNQISGSFFLLQYFTFNKKISVYLVSVVLDIIFLL